MPASALICVCMKPVVRTDVHLRLDEAGHGPRPGETLSAANAADLAALQLALSLRDARAGASDPPRVLALTVAPPSGEALLREALAAGADEVLRVWGVGWPEEPPPADGSGDTTRAMAEAAATVLRERAPVLVLAGERSSDAGHELFGGYLAVALGAALAHRVTAAERATDGWRVTVRLERGYGQALQLPQPAVLTVSAQLPRPGHASLPAWLAARQATLPVAAPGVSAPHGPPTSLRIPVPRVKRYRVPAAGLSAEERIQAMVTLEAGSGGTVLSGEPPEAQADAVLRLLRERGYL